MATKKQKQELIDTIKNPERHYRISINGYGGECAYLSLDKAQYDFWSQRVEEDGEGDLLEYLMEAESGELEFEFEIPKEADFLLAENDGEKYYQAWYDANNEVEHYWGVDFNSAYITVEEITIKSYDADIVETVVDGEELADWVQDVDLEVDQYEIAECKELNADPPEYIMQVYNAEKGTFFEGYFTVTGKFNPAKLRIVSTEYWSGDQVIEDIIYDGVSIENEGGSTNGKGMDVSIWKN